MSFVIDLIKSLLAKEPARVAAYGGTLALAGASWLAALLGVSLPGDVTTAIQVIAIFAVTEAIRRVVYSPASVATIAAASAPAPTPDNAMTESAPVDPSAPPTA